VEVAWGDCACALVLRKDGRERLVAWLKTLGEVQLLLSQDEEPVALEGPLAVCSWEELEERGLSALAEGRVTRISR